MTKVIIYARVSTDDQNEDRQVERLTEHAERCGWEIVEVRREKVSGGKGRAQRPELDAALKAITQRKADKLCVLSIDRLGRSLQDLINTLQTIEAAGAHLYVDDQTIDTSTAMGSMIFKITAIFAEFELSVNNKRVRDGVKAYREKMIKKDPDFHFGRPKKSWPRPVLDKVMQLHAEGMSYRKIAEAVDRPFTSIRDKILQEKKKAA